MLFPVYSSHGWTTCFHKNDSAPIESNKQPAQIFTQPDLFFLVAPCGAHVTVNLPLRGARRRVPSNVPLGGADSGGHAFPPPDGILGRQVREHRRDSKPGVPPKQDSAKPTRPPRPIPPKRALSSPAPALPSLTPTLRTAPPSPAQPNPAQPGPAQPSPAQYYPDLTRNSTVNSSDLLSLLKISISTLQI